MAALVALVSVALSACRASPPDAEPTGTGPADQVVVASFNFPESELLATAYALVLEHAGIPVRRELGLGPRELVAPALREGLVDVVPEYLGSALVSIDPANGVPPHAPQRTTSNTTLTGEQARRELALRLSPFGLQVLEPSAAEDQNGFGVSRATADRLHLERVSDLTSAGSLILAGPSECPRRAYCLAGLESAYGLHVGRFVAYDDQRQRVEALLQGVADVAVVFTTDPDVLSGDIVLLADDRGLQPPENLTPVVSTRAVDRYGQRLTGPLDAISARLTTTALAFLNWRVVVHGGGVEQEARAWLQRQGLLPR